jgi:hypothetical protein
MTDLPGITSHMEVGLTRFDTQTDPEIIADYGNDEERRQHSRNVKVMRVARVKDFKLHAECLGMVRDVSSGGMMIDAQLPIEIGQTVAVALLDNRDFTGEVVWKDGHSFGIRFPEEIDVDDILAKPSIRDDGLRARLPRFSIDRSATILTDNESIKGQLIDISQRGAKLDCKAKLKMHMNILIRLDTARSVRASVKWQVGHLFGLEFHRLFTLDELKGWLE